MTTSHELDIENEGRSAHDQGEPQHYNPYCTGTEEHDLWSFGWLAAADTQWRHVA